jgi:hypothetical protein
LDVWLTWDNKMNFALLMGLENSFMFEQKLEAWQGTWAWERQEWVWLGVEWFCWSVERRVWLGDCLLGRSKI